MMKIYNTYSNTLEDFVPVHEGKVNMYVCGPTVYNYIHIGNARPVIFFDTVRRYLEHRGYEVKFVSNFTDVDDKIITKALELEVKEKEVSEKFIAAFLADVERVNSSTDYIQPKVTEYMDKIIHYIELLVDKGYAYEVEGDVYFRVKHVKDYGVLSNRKIEDLISGARIEVNNKKENPLDFTLWKKTDVGIQFDSRFGKGRPGWHTECVAMIDTIFGEKIDIHAGGSGLMFPHHENEIAQSNVLNGHSIANYWMHNGLLNIQGNKMSKSEGKMVLVKDLTVDSNAFRLFTLSTQYRAPINYSDESLAVYENEWDKTQRVYKAIYLKLDLADMIYANAITALQDLTKKANQMIRSNTEPEVLLSILKVYNDFFDVLGLKINVSPLDRESKEVYKKWEQARIDKDFASADKYRAALQEKGVI